MGEWQDYPDSEGWWAFSGGRWESEDIYEPDPYGEEMEDEDGNTCWMKLVGHRKFVGERFDIVLRVRLSKPGETVCFPGSSGPYHGDTILGYLHTNHPWNYHLHSIDNLSGQWMKLEIPWDDS